MASFTDDISFNTMVGPGAFITGDLKLEGFTRVDGDIYGNLETTGKLIVGENARIRGSLTAKSVIVIGIVAVSAALATKGASEIAGYGAGYI